MICAATPSSRATPLSIYMPVRAGASARKALKRHKGLQRLLEGVQTGDIDIIVSKVSTNVHDYYAVQHILEQHGVL